MISIIIIITVVVLRRRSSTRCPRCGSRGKRKGGMKKGGKTNTTEVIQTQQKTQQRVQTKQKGGNEKGGMKNDKHSETNTSVQVKGA